MPSSPTSTATRGRPTAKRAAAIDRLVLDTARRKFLAEGYDGVALEAVASETGISKGTLYARHASKEALLLAVWENAVESWSDRAARDNHLLTEDIRQRLTRHGRTIAKALLDPDTLAFQRLISANAHRFPSIAYDIHLRGFRYIADVIAQDMEDAGKRDGLPAHHAKVAGEAFVTAITGWMLQQSLVRTVTSEEADIFADRVARIFVDGRNSW